MEPTSRNLTLANRVREIRQELFGENGVRELSNRLGLPEKTWSNYEQGVIIPAPIILDFIEVTGVSSYWLWSGHGAKYRAVSIN